MHDYFDILGVPDSAPPSEVRRVCAARRLRRPHPDFHGGAGPSRYLVDAAAPAFAVPAREVAIDFVDMSGLLDRMQAAFFAYDR